MVLLVEHHCMFICSGVGIADHCQIVNIIEFVLSFLSVLYINVVIILLLTLIVHVWAF